MKISLNILKTKSFDIKLALSEHRISTKTVFTIAMAYYDPFDIANINGSAPL